MEQVLQGLHYLHQSDNILASEVGCSDSGFPSIKLIHFEQSRHIPSDDTTPIRLGRSQHYLEYEGSSSIGPTS